MELGTKGLHLPMNHPVLGPKNMSVLYSIVYRSIVWYSIV